MNSEKVKEIKELLRCMNGEKACTNCYINEVAQEQETCCINVVADMTLDLINELESENERLSNTEIGELIKENEELAKQCVEWSELTIKKRRQTIELKDRIAELEKEVETRKEEVLHLQEYGKKLIRETELKQFAERLKEKSQKSFINVGGLTASAKTVTLHDIDETLKEFI
jgi:hypothetical protein